MNQDILESYRLLEIEPGASLETTKQSYRDLVKVWHPDRFSNDLKLLQRANRKTAQINEAYQNIRNYLSTKEAERSAEQAKKNEEALRRASGEADRKTRDDTAKQSRATAEARVNDERKQTRRAEEERQPEEQNKQQCNRGHFVWIQPGTFVMGSPPTEKDRRSNEGPQTRVTITKGFWMSQYETTNAEYSPLMRGSIPGCIEDLRPTRANWIDAMNYCLKLTQQEQKAGRLPNGCEYRLPTEAEWEYACRAGTTTRFSYGDDLNCASLGQYAWYHNHPVISSTASTG